MVHHANAPPSTRTATPGPARSCQPFLLLAFADASPAGLALRASGFTGARVDVALGPVPGLELTCSVRGSEQTGPPARPALERQALRPRLH